MTSHSSGWSFLFCSACGEQIRPDQVARTFHAARLCPACVADLFNNQGPVRPAAPV